MEEKINYRLRGNALISLVSQLSDALNGVQKVEPVVAAHSVGKTETATKILEAQTAAFRKQRPRLSRDLALIAAFNLSKAGTRFSREELETEAFRVYYSTNRQQRRGIAKNLRSIPRRAQRHRASAGSVTWLSKAVN